MTLMQGYLIGVAFVAVIACICTDVPKQRHPLMFAGALIVIAMWPLIPALAFIGKKLSERESE